jgi:hypothetical protein
MRPDARRAALAPLLPGAIFVLAAAAQPATTPAASSPAAPPASTGTLLPPGKSVAAKVEQVGKARAEGLLGQPVTDAHGDVFGNVTDVLIDADGTPHAAVIQFTGFFGIGARRVAVSWKSLKFSIVQDRIAIRIPLDPATLKAMPDYTDAAASV